MVFYGKGIQEPTLLTDIIEEVLHMEVNLLLCLLWRVVLLVFSVSSDGVVLISSKNS